VRSPVSGSYFETTLLNGLNSYVDKTLADDSYDHADLYVDNNLDETLDDTDTDLNTVLLQVRNPTSARGRGATGGLHVPTN